MLSQQKRAAIEGFLTTIIAIRSKLSLKESNDKKGAGNAKFQINK
jgi:hypothetical protein